MGGDRGHCPRVDQQVVNQDLHLCVCVCVCVCVFVNIIIMTMPKKSCTLDQQFCLSKEGMRHACPLRHMH